MILFWRSGNNKKKKDRKKKGRTKLLCLSTKVKPYYVPELLNFILLQKILKQQQKKKQCRCATKEKGKKFMQKEANFLSKPR